MAWTSSGKTALDLSTNQDWALTFASCNKQWFQQVKTVLVNTLNVVNTGQ